MPSQIPPPADVITHVLVAWLAGLVVLAALTRAWRQVSAGHFKVIWLVTAVLGAGIGFLHAPAWAVAAAGLGTFVLVYRNLDMWGGIVASLAAAGALASLPFESPQAAASAVAGALLLGAVTNAMLLGHWHLHQPRLGTGPLKRLVWLLWAGVVAYAGVAVVVATTAPDAADIALVAGITAGAFVLFSGVLTAMVTHLVRTRSIMSATGILYLQILLCFVAVFTGSLGALAI